MTIEERIKVSEKLVNALCVMVLDKKIRAFLEDNDPMALKQAEEALASAGVNIEEVRHGL